ncbi:MAG: 2,3,4,5-tetrahydropyridine-2,6-dicarboxylate N-succinyltransferase [Neisseriales bacterium]|nr:MAG: 2,3,4,5-tetrahydropyridine-2,6-dicarboxylate N-succinyltransferase [Neisseriales bacterium]
MYALHTVIEKWFEERHHITPDTASDELKDAIVSIIMGLDQGTLRVAEKINGLWYTHEWLKKAVLLSFLIRDNTFFDAPIHRYYDKVLPKFITWEAKDFSRAGVRVVPGALARQGAYIANNTVLMPSYTNIGAYIDEGTMVDSWVTVGSCAQIGKCVHLSSNVVIGGVLEPLQATPTIIEDHCFIGAGSAIVEGVIVEEGSVVAMGVTISQSTRIYHRQTKQISYGRIPTGSVVVAGSLPSEDNSCSLYCAVIVKQVDAKTRAKTRINQLLREI